MALIPITSGAYQSTSVIANAQRCVNLYPEANPEETKPPVPVTHYLRPGKRLLGTPPVAGRGRLAYRATNGDLYVVINDTVYYVSPAWQFFNIGNIGANITPVFMADNGQTGGNRIVLVDGSPNGYQITMTTRAFAPIVDPSGLFVGADTVQFLQTFFLFNKPRSNAWYISLANSVTFNALNIAAKSSVADFIQTIGVRLREVWLLGTLSTEPWSLVGGVDFPFESIPSTLVPYGCLAKYSMMLVDVALFWIAQNQQGKAVVVRTEGYQVVRVSNHAIESILQKAGDISDAVGDTYQINGHTFYVIHFPTADLTLAYDLSTKQWHQEAWTDTDGVLHRDRAAFYALAYNTLIGLDWETGKIYELTDQVYTDNGDPISFIRGFPHVTDEMRRITHWNLIADMECGTIQDQEADPQLNLRYSDDRGQSWSDWLQTSLGKTGQYDTSPQFPRLGMARDRVYELMWSENMKTALNGVYIDPEPSET